MLLENETKIRFNHLPKDLSSGSKKKVCVECDYCHTIVEKTMDKLSQSRKKSDKDCCKRCKSVKQHETIRRAGTMVDISEKRKNTNLEKYGTVSPLQNPAIKEKIEADCLAQHGIKHHIARQDVKEKCKETMIARHGYDSPFKDPEFQRKNRITVHNKYGCFRPSQIHMSAQTIANLENRAWLLDQHHVQKKCLTTIASELGLSATSKTVADWCRRHDISIQKHIVSGPEKEISQFLSSIGIDYKTSDRSLIAPQELDIFIPSKNIAIEYCGLYWHSDVYKDRGYHKKKMDLCNAKGVRLITIFEDEWLLKRTIVEERIRHILGVSSEKIGSRKCEIVSGKFDDFIEKHHVQGRCSSKVQFALKHNDEIVAVMTFGKPRFNKEYEWELLRFVSKGSVIGGAGKLFLHFVRTYNPKSVLSYCDLRWGTGDLYTKLGFRLARTTQPSFSFVKDQMRMNRMKFCKNRLKGMDLSKTQAVLAEEAGYTKIYDCGQQVFVWEPTLTQNFSLIAP